ncbi:unnamed protein product [Citrullus colocynthis]|uniref:Uncharacterized protein n=1 Tax=Citrullus colocynthis TaxID=252529 RepID=A0ABP0YWR5_9ROSI
MGHSLNPLSPHNFSAHANQTLSSCSRSSHSWRGVTIHAAAVLPRFSFCQFQIGAHLRSAGAACEFLFVVPLSKSLFIYQICSSDLRSVFTRTLPPLSQVCQSSPQIHCDLFPFLDPHTPYSPPNHSPTRTLFLMINPHKNLPPKNSTTKPNTHCPSIQLELISRTETGQSSKWGTNK